MKQSGARQHWHRLKNKNQKRGVASVVALALALRLVRSGGHPSQTPALARQGNLQRGRSVLYGCSGCGGKIGGHAASLTGNKTTVSNETSATIAATVLGTWGNSTASRAEHFQLAWHSPCGDRSDTTLTPETAVVDRLTFPR